MRKVCPFNNDMRTVSYDVIFKQNFSYLAYNLTFLPFLPITSQILQKCGIKYRLSYNHNGCNDVTLIWQQKKIYHSLRRNNWQGIKEPPLLILTTWPNPSPLSFCLSCKYSVGEVAPKNMLFEFSLLYLTRFFFFLKLGFMLLAVAVKRLQSNCAAVWQ